MKPKDIPELITRFAEAVRDQEQYEGPSTQEHIQSYREARSELAVRFHKVLEEGPPNGKGDLRRRRDR